MPGRHTANPANHSILSTARTHRRKFRNHRHQSRYPTTLSQERPAAILMDCCSLNNLHLR
jgi:hypothetical protein